MYIGTKCRCRLAGMFRVQAHQRSRDSIWPRQVIDLLHTLRVFCASWCQLLVVV